LEREKIKIKSKSCESRPRPRYFCRIQPFNRAEPSRAYHLRAAIVTPLHRLCSLTLIPPAFTLYHFRQRRWPPLTFPTFKVPCSEQGSLSMSYPSNTSSKMFTSSPSVQTPPETPTASDLLSGSYDPAKLHPMASLCEQLDYLVLDNDKTNDLPGSGIANTQVTHGHVFGCGLNPIGCLSPSSVITDIHHPIAFFRLF
jgi:hypothetical protein